MKKLILILVILLGLLVRFYDFPNRVNFSGEQGLSLSVTADYIHHGLSLLGMPNWQRSTSTGLILHTGALFNYGLLPLVLLFRYQPLPITAVFTLLNVATGLLLFLFARKKFGFLVGIITLFLFLTNSLMISHSLFIWLANVLPIVGVLTVFLLIRFREKQEPWVALFLGILSGVGINLEYFYLFTAVLVGGLIIFSTRKRFASFLLFACGLALGNITILLFDLRHQWYHVATVWQYFLDTIKYPGQNKIADYHFLQFWPLFSLIGGILLAKVYQRKKVIAVLILAAYVTFNLTSGQVSFVTAVGMPKGMKLADMENAAKIISENENKKFNIVFLPDQDFRAHAIRYLLNYVYHTSPENEENYASLDELFVVAEKNHQFGVGDPWEITVFGKANVQDLGKVGDRYALFKLTHL